MRILFFTPAYPPFPGGGERYVCSLAQALQQAGHVVTAVTSHARTETDFWQGCAADVRHETVDGIHLIRCPIRPFPGGRPGLMAWRKAMVLTALLPLKNNSLLPKMAGMVPPLTGMETVLPSLVDSVDIVHGFNISWEQTMLGGQQWAQAQNVPYVATPFAHLGTGNDRVARNSTMPHQMDLLRRSDRVLVLTTIEQKELTARGVAADRLDVIGGGLDPLPPLPDPQHLKEQFQLTVPFVIFVGRASFDKGALHAAQAVLALQAAGRALTLLFVGQSSPEFQRFYNRLSAAEQGIIRPLGILSESDKHGLIAGAEALLLPSRTDSFGIVLLEAWAHQKPVIAAAAGGIPGVVDAGSNGLLVPFGEVSALAQAIAQLLDNQTLKETLGQNGHNKVTQTYTWPRVAERVLSHYQQIIGHRA